MGTRKAGAAKLATKQPSLDDISEAARLLPSISEEDVTAALTKARKPLSFDKQSDLVGAMQIAFKTFFIAKIWELGLKGSTASQTEKKLTGIVVAAERLAAALDIEQPSDTRRPAYLALTRSANAYGEKIGGYPGLSPTEFDAVRDNDGKPVVRRMDYRGGEKLKDIREGVALLLELAQGAAAYERMKVERHKSKRQAAGKKAKAVRERDEAIVRFYGDFTGAWMDAFDELPRVSRSPITGVAGGPTVRFLSALFSVLAGKVSPELEARVPGLRRALRPTKDVISNRIRACTARQSSWPVGRG